MTVKIRMLNMYADCRMAASVHEGPYNPTAYHTAAIKRTSSRIESAVPEVCFLRARRSWSGSLSAAGSESVGLVALMPQKTHEWLLLHADRSAFMAKKSQSLGCGGQAANSGPSLAHPDHHAPFSES